MAFLGALSGRLGPLVGRLEALLGPSWVLGSLGAVVSWAVLGVLAPEKASTLAPCFHNVCQRGPLTVS